MQFLLPLLLLLLISPLLTKSTLKIQTHKSTVQSNRQWSRVKLGVSGAKGSVRYFYDQFPAGWKQVRDYLYAPKNALDEKKKYPCKVRVKDNAGDSQSATVVLVSDQKGLQVSNEVFDYGKDFDMKFYGEDGFFGKPEMKKNILAMLQDKQNSSNNVRVNPKELPMIKGIATIAERPGSGLSNLSNFLDNVFTNKKKQFDEKFHIEEDRPLKQMSSESGRARYRNRYISRKDMENDFDRGFNKFWRFRNPYENNNQDHFQSHTFHSRFSNTLRPNYHNNQDTVLQQKPQIKTEDKIPIKNSTSSEKIISTSSSLPPIISTKEASSSIKQSLNAKPNLTNLPSASSLESQDVNHSLNQLEMIGSIKKSEGLQNRSVQSIDSIFLKLPSSEELDSIIVSADGYAIIKTVQNTLQSNLSCEQKYSYLADFLGRIHSAIQMKSFAENQLKVIIDSAKREIQRINTEIAKSEEMKSSLKIKSLKQQLDLELLNLEKQYNLFNEVQIQIQPNYAKIKGYEADIQILRNSSDTTRVIIQAQKLNLTEINSEIVALQRSLEEAKSKKRESEQKIQTMQQQLLINKQKIDQDFRQIAILQKQIDSLEEKSDNLKIIYTTLEIKVERMSQDIEKLVDKENSIDERLNELQEKRDIQQEKLVIDQLNRISIMIETLKDRIFSIQEEVDRTYYECYNLSDVSTTQTGGTLVYTVGNKDFYNYLHSSYGNISIKSSVTSSLQIIPVDILSSEWQLHYGSPFSNQQITLSDSFSFKDDFNCLNPDSLIAGEGKIKKIHNKSIIVEMSDKSESILHLGACTRLESVGGLPKTGQSIYFKGNKSGVSKNQFDVYRASCL